MSTLLDVIEVPNGQLMLYDDMVEIMTDDDFIELKREQINSVKIDEHDNNHWVLNIDYSQA